MRVSLEWLNDYVDISGLRAEDIAEALTQSGLEVEDIETTGPHFNGVVVGHVKSIAQHPNADRLRLVTVDLGTLGTTQVVCGAPNVRENIRIAFAQDGATVLSRKDGSTFQLSKTSIRGVESAGMVCSLEELGLEKQFSNTEDGIWPLDSVANIGSSPLGQDLKQALGLSGDVVLHVAPPANRGDLMSMQGVAREVAALFQRSLKPTQAQGNAQAAKPGSFEVSLQQGDVCGYYAGASLENITIGDAPDWMVRRLQAAGVRSINNVVDITNYVMLETGQPLHAFDARKLGAKGSVGVRRANAGETLTTLDDVSRPLTSDSIVITINDSPVALAGLMGGQTTEVDSSTQSLFLESAFFPGAMIRKSAKSVGLRSEASARFERGTDITQSRKALGRAVELLQTHAGSALAALVESDSQAVKEKPVSIPLSQSRLEQILGITVPAETVIGILDALGFHTHTQANGDWSVSIPAARQSDVTRPIDLIEEIARIYGYDQIPYTLPQKTGTAQQTPRARFLAILNGQLQGHGLQEVMTPSLIGPALLEKTGFLVTAAKQTSGDEAPSKLQGSANEFITVLNSHSVEHTLMRQSLIPGLLEVAQYNQAQGTDELWIYELGRTYFQRGKASARHAGVAERLRLGGLLMGSNATNHWKKECNAPIDFYAAKGILETLLEILHLSGRVTFIPATHWPDLHPGKSAELVLDGKTSLGFLGQLHPARQEALKLRRDVFLFELDGEALAKAAVAQADKQHFRRLAQYPGIQRDMALLAPNSLNHAQIVDTLLQQKEPLLRDVALFDEYRSEQLGPDKRSLAYRLTFRSDEATLTESDVEQRLGRLKSALTEALPVQLR